MKNHSRSGGSYAPDGRGTRFWTRAFTNPFPKWRLLCARWKGHGFGCRRLHRHLLPSDPQNPLWKTLLAALLLCRSSACSLVRGREPRLLNQRAPHLHTVTRSRETPPHTNERTWMLTRMKGHTRIHLTRSHSRIGNPIARLPPAFVSAFCLASCECSENLCV